MLTSQNNYDLNQYMSLLCSDHKANKSQSTITVYGIKKVWLLGGAKHVFKLHVFYTFLRKIHQMYSVCIIHMIRMCVSVLVLYSAKAVSRGFNVRFILYNFRYIQKRFFFCEKITNDIFSVGIIKMMRMCVSVMVLHSAKAVSRGFPARVTWM